MTAMIKVKVYKYDLWADGDGGMSVNDVFGLGSFECPASAWDDDTTLLDAARAAEYTVGEGCTIDNNMDTEHTAVILDSTGQCVGEFRREDLPEE